MSNCPYCNSQVNENSKFCANCGAPLMQNPNNKPMEAFIQNDGGMNQSGQYQQPIPVPPHPQVNPQPSNYNYGQPHPQSYNTNYNKPQKKKGSCLKTILIVIGALIGLGILGSIFGGSSSKDQNTVNSTDEVKKTEKEKGVEEPEASNEDSEKIAEDDEEPTKDPSQLDLSDALAEFESGDYAYITLDDLSRYIVNMKGQKVYTIVELDEIYEDKLQSNIDDGFMFQSFMTSVDYTDYFKEGDIVAIYGTVGESQDYYVAVTTDIVDSKIFAYGDEAKKYKKNTTDESLAEFLVVTEEVANAEGKNSISEEEFKSLCESYSYENILRNPDSYKKKYVVLSGSVDQTVEGIMDLYTTLYITDDYGQKWDCTIYYKEGQSRVLEGDYVTVYGILNGTSTSTTVLGKQVTMPSVQIEYVE